MNRQTRPDFVDYSIVMGSALGVLCGLGVLALFLSGCSESHDPREGTIVCIDARRDCPPSWVCEEHYCWSRSETDAGAPPNDDGGDVPIDAASPEDARVLPDVHISSPPDGSVAIPIDSGSAFCSDSTLPSSAETWQSQADTCGGSWASGWDPTVYEHYFTTTPNADGSCSLSIDIRFGCPATGSFAYVREVLEWTADRSSSVLLWSPCGGSRLSCHIEYAPDGIERVFFVCEEPTTLETCSMTFVR